MSIVLGHMEFSNQDIAGLMVLFCSPLIVLVAVLAHWVVRNDLLAAPVVPALAALSTFVWTPGVSGRGRESDLEVAYRFVAMATVLSLLVGLPFVAHRFFRRRRLRQANTESAGFD